MSPENNTQFSKSTSLSAKTARSTLLSCLFFGLIIQLVAVSFYAFAFIKQYINTADATARQVRISATHGADAVKISKEVMSIYNSLSDADRAKVGTREYRELFSGFNTGDKSDYADVLTIIRGVRGNQNVSDIYIGMYDKDNNSLVIIADTNDTTKGPDLKMPGDWLPVTEKEVNKFLNGKEDDKRYIFTWDNEEGFLITVGVPITDDSGTVTSFMLVDISAQDILVGMRTLALQLTLVIILITILLAFFQTKTIEKKLVTPINKIAEASQQYARDRQAGIDNKEHFNNIDIHTKDELENLALAMKDMEHELAEYEANLTNVIAEKERIGTELSLATAIQKAMLPHIFPPFPERSEFDIYAKMEPAREVGGDFYDFFLIDSDHLCLVIADVSGKGIPAALFMMISKTILQSVAMLGHPAGEILKKTNEALCSNNQVEMFVTAWVGIVEISTGKLIAANAGHEYPMIRHEDGSFEIYKDKHGLVIGGMIETVYTEYQIDLKPGDKIFLYTDGITEASDAEGRMYGMDRLLDALNQAPDGSAQEIINNVRSSVDSFVKEAEQFDDLTMLCFEYNGSN